MLVKKTLSPKSKHFYKTLLKVYHDIASTASLHDALMTLINMTTSAIGCERGSIFLNDPKTDELYSFIAQGKLPREIRVLNDKGLIGWSFTNDQSVIIPDA